MGATVVHVIFIQGWNKVYRSVATRLTERENHRTEEVWLHCVNEGGHDPRTTEDISL